MLMLGVVSADTANWLETEQPGGLLLLVSLVVMPHEGHVGFPLCFGDPMGLDVPGFWPASFFCPVPVPGQSTSQVLKCVYAALLLSASTWVLDAKTMSFIFLISSGVAHYYMHVTKKAPYNFKSHRIIPRIKKHNFLIMASIHWKD
jgi:hypothetical protein